MYYEGLYSNPHSKTRPIPKYTFLFKDFKLLVEYAVRLVDLNKRFKPRLYSYADFVLVKFYALAHDRSVEWASNTLNEHFSTELEHKQGKKLKIFADGQRKRRLIPHQTDVDKLFRTLTESEVHTIFGFLLSNLNLKIKKATISNSNMRFLADNTKYPYYGSDRTSHEIGGVGMPGTMYCRMFQGHSLNGCGMTLFTDFYPIEKGKYRGKNIGPSIDWLKWCGFNISYSCVDREFYRVMVIRDLRKRQVPIIIPVKKYKGVRREMEKFLRNQRDVCDDYLFAQTSKQYPNQSSALIHLVLIGHNDIPAEEIRKMYRNGKLSFQEAMDKLAGFFTSMSPWKNKKAWYRWLVRAYKIRWNIETGFKMLNLIHESFRNNYYTVQLSQLYMRALIYNNWQFVKKINTRKKIKKSERSLKNYIQRIKPKIRETISLNIKSRLKYQSNRKKDVYF